MIDQLLIHSHDHRIWIFAFISVFLFFTISCSIWKRKRPLPYYSLDRLLTQGEAAFYRSLRKAVPPQFEISRKVRLADIVHCSSKTLHRGFGKMISSQHIDFVITEKKTGAIKLAIELNDKSHDQPEIKKRDAWKNRVLRSAGIPLMRVRAKSSYDTRTLQKQFFATLDTRDENQITARRQRLS